MTNNQPIFNPSPKARFAADGSASAKHRTLVTGDDYQRAVDFGLMQYSTVLASQVSDGNTAMAAGFMLRGAVEFINTMRMLPEIKAPVTISRIGVLDEKA